MAMTLERALERLESLGSEAVRKQNRKRGAGDNHFGVRLGDIRTLAREIKLDYDLALELWNTGNIDAQLLAILLLQPKRLSAEQLDGMVRTGRFSQVADWLNAYVVAHHPEKETLRQRWMQDEDPWAARAGWSLTAGRIARSPEGLDLPALLDRIESEMPTAPPETQWTMNNSLAAIGIHFPEHRVRAIEIGEALGVFRDYPVSKGCTSPFAPIWINEIVRRRDSIDA
jgi:3-methyladenine DNA glycosylase AlkD